jgi:large subunit ribosomal protein L5
MRLKEKYNKEIVPQMMKMFNYKNRMAVPELEKIVINMGIGEATENPKALDSAASELSLISGQKPVITRARKSVSGFKLRAGMPIGCKVTLRGPRMYEFFDRLVNVSLPRVRDFRGLDPQSFDGRGNYTLGLEEQLIFPEIDYEKVDKVRGMNITIVSSAKSNKEARELLKMLGMPLKETKNG